MKIILILDYEGLGKAGDLIDVKPGFARNKLFLKGLHLEHPRKTSLSSKRRKDLSRLI